MVSMEQSTVERMPLGRTGIQISPVGVGTWQWGDRRFWGYDSGSYTDVDLRADLYHLCPSNLREYSQRIDRQVVSRLLPMT